MPLLAFLPARHSSAVSPNSPWTTNTDVRQRIQSSSLVNSCGITQTVDLSRSNGITRISSGVRTGPSPHPFSRLSTASTGKKNLRSRASRSITTSSGACRWITRQRTTQFSFMICSLMMAGETGLISGKARRPFRRNSSPWTKNCSSSAQTAPYARCSQTIPGIRKILSLIRRITM